MAVFRCFECILYFFICFVISRSPVQVRPVAPRAEISLPFIFSFSETHFKIQYAKRVAHSNELTASAQKKTDDALADMLSGKD